MRASLFPPPLLVLVLVLGAAGLSCFDLSWREGIACSSAGTCPNGLTCCHDACLRRCPPGDAAANSDGDRKETPVCPAQIGGCVGCTVGCPCSCGGVQLVCCMQPFGVGACSSSTCP
ncbi:MAG TPA: hypothetical protein VNO55_11850 [Polyangia bacterium]|nr:hypothetical protein [Polyangia bacterium]